MRSTPPKHPSDAYWTLPGDAEVNYEAVQHFNDAKWTLRNSFHRPRFLPRQIAAVNAAATGYDLIISLPTSAGKSLCYQLPALLDQSGFTVVVSPTRALIEDQLRNLYQINDAWKSLAIRSHFEKRQDPRNPRVKLFYICPEWFDARRNRELFNDLCQKGTIVRIVVDEAHQALKMPLRPVYGSSDIVRRGIRPAYQWILQIRKQFSDIPFTLVSASSTAHQIQQLTSQLNMYGTCVRVDAPLDRPNLYYQVIPVPKSRPKHSFQLRSIAQYIKDHSDDCGLIFVRTRKKAESVAEQLQAMGVGVEWFHAGARDKLDSMLERFHSGAVKVVVCTSAFGEGINKSNIRFVFHWSLPPSMPQYFQETGRAGRDSLPSRCILFYSFSDLRTVANIVAYDQSNGERVVVAEQKRDLAKIVLYCNDTLSCRRVHILDPFEQAQVQGSWLKQIFINPTSDQECGSCDVCEHRTRQGEEAGFEEIPSEILAAVEESFQNDTYLHAKKIAKRMCANNRLGISEDKAEGYVEYLAAAGYLMIHFEFQGKGFNVLLKKGDELVESAYIPKPIPHDMPLAPPPPPRKKPVRPLAEATTTNRQREIPITLDINSSSEDDLDGREDQSSDEEALIKESTLKGKRKRDPSVEPVEASSPKRVRSQFATPRRKAPVQELVTRFREETKKVSNSWDRQQLKKVSDSTLKRVLGRYHEYLLNKHSFETILYEEEVTQAEFDTLTDFYEWIQDNVLFEMLDLHLPPNKYTQEKSLF